MVSNIKSRKLQHREDPSQILQQDCCVVLHRLDLKSTKSVPKRCGSVPALPLTFSDKKSPQSKKYPSENSDNVAQYNRKESRDRDLGARALSDLNRRQSFVPLQRLQLTFVDKIDKVSQNKTSESTSDISQGNEQQCRPEEVHKDIESVFGGELNCSITVKFQVRSPGEQSREAAVSVPFYCAPIVFQKVGSAAQFEKDVNAVLQNARNSFVCTARGVAGM